ncbi:NAD(P)/FAD-dependent oxidoreductase [Nitrosomonas sp.]|uniref:NAD(P)/FAD-dependent oxidoreductase n=1 Tax=Nitrosomonas sp. TaxID=42353 RepID=UPI0020886E44|nr:FAD-dependent oxidoreductase [Nitrosomonas sp.]GJL75209.1 MAG: pyridine nucleotide-disulfide oxidoreductase [Nitrosomonas sp.]
MALLPFYIPGQRRIKAVIVGGGYAGLTALTTLKQYSSNVDITIIDPGDQHLKVTHLHETFRYPLSDLLVSFSVLESRFNCRHIRAALAVTDELLLQWQNQKCLMVDDEVIDFDYLIVTTGADTQTQQFDHIENVFTLQHFMQTPGSELLLQHLSKLGQDAPLISVVGAGATGIQFLFEIRQFLCRQKITARLRLIHSSDQVLAQFPRGFDTYVRSCLQDLDIDFIPDTRYRGQTDYSVLLEEKQTGRSYELTSHATFLFLGKKQENIFPVNMFGQAVVDHQTLQNIFVAGDCSVYTAFGSNIQSAQSAVRKGKLVGRNILRHSGMLKILEPYLHHDIGYVVNLGPSDAVGWLITQGNIVTGIPALAIKELVEAQYDLLLMGIDTYVV